MWSLEPRYEKAAIGKEWGYGNNAYLTSPGQAELMDQVQFDSQLRSRVLIALQKAIVENYQERDWNEFGCATGQQDFIRSHRRLLRSLSWQDEDHAGEALTGCLVAVGLSEAHVPALILLQLSAS